jgi:hypothetical protein
MVYNNDNNKRKKYDDHSVDLTDVNFELQASNKPPSPKKTRKAELESLPKKRELESAKDLMPRQKKSTPAALESKSLPAPKKMPSAAARSISSNPPAAILPPIIQKKSFVRETSNKIFKCELLYTPSPIMTKIAEDSYMKDLPYSSSESSSSSGSDSDSSPESSSSSGSDSDSSPESSSSSGSDSDSSPEPEYSSEDFYSDNAPTPKFTTFATRWIDLVNEVHHIEFRQSADPETLDEYFVVQYNNRGKIVPILELTPDYYSVSYFIFVDQNKDAIEIERKKSENAEKPVWEIVSEMRDTDIMKTLNNTEEFNASYQSWIARVLKGVKQREKEMERRMKKRKGKATRKKGVVEGNHKKNTV